jgi:hypothetical protein
MFNAEFFCDFRKSMLFADEQNFNVGQQCPRPDCIALNRRNVRIDEGFGGRK